MKIISPVPGRVVHYWPDEREGFTVLDRARPCAATVAFVHTDRRVNLTVHDHLGVVHSLREVQLVQPDDPRPQDGGYCSWMPYQIGQAQSADTRGI